LRQSNDAANAFLNRIMVVPASSQTARLYPAEAFITVAGERQKVMADQIATASKQRLLRRVGALTPDDLAGVARAVAVQLGL